MKKHSAVVEAQLQARQSETEELAIVLRDKAQLVVHLQERVRVEELAELPCVLAGHAPGGMSVAQWAEGLATALPGSQAASFREWMAGCQVAATRPTAGEISDLKDELWRRMNQASTVCGMASDCGASTGQPSAGGSATSSTPTLAQSSTPCLGSHDDAKGKVKGAEGKDGQHTKGHGPSATQPFRSARVEGEPLSGSSRDA